MEVCSAVDPLYDDIYDILVGIDEEEPTEGTSQVSSVQACSSIRNSIEAKRRRRRRRLEVPKVFKNDVRWTYTNMLVNVMSSLDVYLMFSFLKTYAIDDFHNKLKRPPSGLGEGRETVGIAAFVKYWYPHALMSPDVVYQVNSIKITNFADESSQISANLVVLGNYLYEEPLLENDSDVSTDIPDEVLSESRKRLPQSDLSRCKGGRSLGKTGLKLPNRMDSRIKVEGADVDDEDMNLLDALQSLTVSTFSANPQKVVVSGNFCMSLDRHKRITGVEYTAAAEVQAVRLEDLQ